MKKRILIALVVVLALTATASLVWANPGDPWADSPISISRVTSGTTSGGTPLNTSADNIPYDDGSDATGAPDWAANRTWNTISVLGFDQGGTVDPGDDAGGIVVLAFTDNVCLDGTGPDLYIYDAWRDTSVLGNESADIEVAIGSGSFAAAGGVSPGAYNLDVSGARPYFTRVRLTATDFAGQLTSAGLDLDAVECLHSVDISDISLFATPPSDENPVGTEHTVTATLLPAIHGVEVTFTISGPNSGQSGTADTNASGVASFTYTGSSPGTDSIVASVMFEGTTITAPAVEKIWLEHYVTGGGRIDEGKGREAPVITFAGTVGFDVLGDVVGQWQVNFHNVNVDDPDKGRFHSTDFLYLNFADIPCGPDPNPPVADYNRAWFEAVGRFNGEAGWKVEVRMTDFGEPGQHTDSILFILRDPDGSIVYRSPDDWGGDFERNETGTCSGSNRTKLDGGNLQIHPPDLP